MGVDLALVVRGAARQHAAVLDDRLERRRRPEVERIDRLDVVVAVDDHRRGVRGMQPVARRRPGGRRSRSTSTCSTPAVGQRVGEPRRRSGATSAACSGRAEMLGIRRNSRKRRGALGRRRRGASRGRSRRRHGRDGGGGRGQAWAESRRRPTSRVGPVPTGARPEIDRAGRCRPARRMLPVRGDGARAVHRLRPAAGSGSGIGWPGPDDAPAPCRRSDVLGREVREQRLELLRVDRLLGDELLGQGHQSVAVGRSGPPSPAHRPCR